MTHANSFDCSSPEGNKMTHTNSFECPFDFQREIK